MSLIREYQESLAALTGNDFQGEVCARLQSMILGFQTVPAKPSGDAGLDGFSHDGEHGYCCYGPEHDAFTTKAQLTNAIVTKFKSDLRRLFELDFKKAKLICIDSPEMETILRVGQRIKHIKLLVNWFESHRILSPISTAVAGYKTISKCRYVDRDVTVVVIGPKELANLYAVDEITIARARQRVFVRSVQAAAEAVTIDNPKDFDFKMNVLREICPGHSVAIQTLTEQLRADWRMAIAFENKLDSTLPMFHRVLEDDRKRILTRVVELMLESNQPWTQLRSAGNIAQSILDKEFGQLFGSLIMDVSSGEIARLIGECPIGWERQNVANDEHLSS